MTNILQAIATIINNPIPDLLSHYRSQSKNRINAVGDALEEFVKDAFANTIYETNLSKKMKYIVKNFPGLAIKIILYSSDFQLIGLIRKSKYLSLPISNRAMLEAISDPGFSIKDKPLKSPDNPAMLAPIKIISYQVKIGS